MISSPGIGSGLDINSIVSQLLAAERQPLDALNQREAEYQAQLSAFGKVKSALATFQAAAKSLDSDKFRMLNASPSDSSLFTASAGATAAPGTHSVEINQLAQNHMLASAGFSGIGESVGSGTLTIRFGSYDSASNTFTQNADKASASITIDASNGSLAGIRDAINAANAGVRASIINDGTATGYRLVLSSADSGAANGMKITVSDSDGNSLDDNGLSRLAFDPEASAGNGKNLIQTAAARDAQLLIDGIAITRPSNTVSDAIPGVTLNLARTNAGLPATLEISRNAEAVAESVQSFVDAYNDASRTLRELTAYDDASKQAAVLQGDSTMRMLQTQLRSMLNTPIPSTGSLTTLSQIGVSFQKDGTLAVDAAKLQTAITEHFDDIGSLFAASARSTDSLVAYYASSPKTQAGTYAVDITQLATRGETLGSQAANLSIVAGVNDQIGIEVDGIAVSVTLSAGTYASADALAAEVQSRINGAGVLADAGAGVTVTHSGGILRIVSNRYGAASSVNVTGGNGAADLLGTPTATAGVNVAGSINGVPATGNGQILTGAAGDASEGLALKIIGGGTGARGSVNFSRGYASQFDLYLESVLDSDGSLAARTDGINSSIKSLDRRQEQMEARLEQLEIRYRAQFAALDAMIASMNSTSTFLSQQLAMLPGSEA